MNKNNALRALLQPRSVAVIGATDKKGRVGRTIFEGLLRSGLPVYPVHPTEATILGHRAYSRPEDLPPDVDLAVVAIGAPRAVDASEQCARHGIPALIVVGGGFSETGEAGKRLEARLKAIGKRFGTRILGPNTLGIFLPDQDLDTIFVEHGDTLLANRSGRGVAFITQSGSVGVEALGLAGIIGYDLSGFVGLGNACDLDELDFLEHFAGDERTGCLAFYLESLKQGHARTFLTRARQTSRSKPVVVLKAGRSPSGAAAVSSHTGRLAGSDRVVQGALRQFGVQRVYDDEELCDASRTLAMLRPAPGNRVAIVTPAGGYGVIGADHVEARSHPPLEMARLAPETQARIRSVTPPFAATGNPVDLTAGASNAMVAETLDALLDDEGVDIILCVAFFAPPSISDDLVDVIAQRASGPKPLIVFTEYGPWTHDYLHRFHERGVVGFPSIGRAVRAARVLVERAEILRALEEETQASNRSDYQVLESFSGDAGAFQEQPDEYEVKQYLLRAGIAVPRSIVVEPGDNEFIPPFAPPFFVKVCSSAILHKTDVGGVARNVSLDALPSVVADFRRRFPGQRLLVEERVPFDGVEIIVGAMLDPTLGRAIMVGAGGVLAELYQDVAFRLIPCSRGELGRMLDELVVAPVFRGFRGLAGQRDSLVDILERVQSLVAAVGDDFNQLDLNPIVWSGDQWVALDAKLVLRAP